MCGTQQAGVAELAASPSYNCAAATDVIRRTLPLHTHKMIHTWRFLLQLDLKDAVWEPHSIATRQLATCLKVCAPLPRLRTIATLAKPSPTRPRMHTHTHKSLCCNAYLHSITDHLALLPAA
jgi:hypothetical protein